MRVVLIPLVLLASCGLSTRPQLPEKLVGSCRYTNKFAGNPECRDYLGSWTKEAATKDCEGQSSKVVFDQACQDVDVLAWCLIDNEDGTALKVTFPGTDASECGTDKTGCEVFAGGYFDPAPVCGGAASEGADWKGTVFQPPELICKAPKAGEAPGKGANGQVCTWQAISGATEEGRTFSDYADCAVVRTQRPYNAAAEDENIKKADPRMEDPAFVAEVEWVRSQVRASACICCHSNAAPQGASNWNMDTPGNFVNGFHNRGLAMAAGWIDTVGFGAYDKEKNNGFVRPTPADPHLSMFPTTDSDRMVQFFAGEALHRGLQQTDFANQPPGAGPLDIQRLFKPSACTNGEGVTADGTVIWRGSKARYLYVLEEGATSPTVPPNLDLPEGTLWRIDVPWTGSAVSSGKVKYGVVPTGLVQKFPASGTASKLESGKQYYLYVLADIAVPVTRCLFRAP